MTDYPPATLRLSPQALPAMRVAYERALDDLGRELQNLANVGYLKGPWLGDPVSMETVAFYNARVMDAPDGPYAALLAYQQELMRVRDRIADMEADYRRTEGDNVELWGRL
ncbi:hypothetical protein ACVGOW_22890 [Pseudonocardia saturnea]